MACFPYALFSNRVYAVIISSMKTKHIGTAIVVLVFISMVVSSIFVGGWNPPQAGNTEEVQNKTNNQPIMKHLVTIKTNIGEIEIATYDEDAPKTVENFITLANKGFYNGVIFHRVIEGFMIQGGDPTGTGTGGPGYKFEDELNPATLSYQEGYKKGVVAMANSGKNTNGSQFFIMLADNPLQHDYTIFGKVIKGQEVVDAIGSATTDANDRPLSPVKMESVSVISL